MTTTASRWAAGPLDLSFLIKSIQHDPVTGKPMVLGSTELWVYVQRGVSSILSIFLYWLDMTYDVERAVTTQSSSSFERPLVHNVRALIQVGPDKGRRQMIECGKGRKHSTGIDLLIGSPGGIMASPLGGLGWAPISSVRGRSKGGPKVSATLKGLSYPCGTGCQKVYRMDG